MERKTSRCLQDINSLLGPRVHQRRHLLHVLLPLQDRLRPSSAVHRTGSVELPPLQSLTTSSKAARHAAVFLLQKEPKERVQEAQGLELHHPHVDSGRNRVSCGRNSSGGGYQPTRAFIECDKKLPRLLCSQCVDTVHEFLHHSQLPH